MNGFGVDFSALPDLSFGLKTVLSNLQEALFRRLITPRGALVHQSDYGFDVRQYINEGLSLEVIYELETLVSYECEKDERVYQASAKLTLRDPVSGLLSITVETSDGIVNYIFDLSSERGLSYASLPV